ncbi:hypothetical protein J3458_008898 [Metarhizium acridum]|uniref:uncharacterized protein n=1 Tax=Metarhizium acridum TaxID=92637 RepID=UPI001C6D138C|nr:hypothetical protein J3458_008898 [Metarhizium acridum]
MSTPSGTRSTTTFALLMFLALYSVTNFVLCVASLVAWKKARDQAGREECSIQGILCGYTAWAIYPVQAAAGLISGFMAVLMFSHGLLRTIKARLDPLYVFRGVFFTLIMLVLIAVVGWSSLDYIDHDSSSLVDTRGNLYPHISGGLWDRNLLNRNITPSWFVGIGGAFIVSMQTDVPGTVFAIGMVHFNIIFGAAICGLAVALAPPTSVLVGAHSVGHGSV